MNLQEQAKRNIKKYKTAKALISLMGVILYFSCAFWGPESILIPALIFCIFFITYAPVFFLRRYIDAPLLKDLNAPLYREIIAQGKLFVPSAIWQLQAEYFVGEYRNAVSICHQKLGAPKIPKKYRYHYWVSLANVYFDIGDDNALAAICQMVQNEWGKESKRKAKQIAKQFPRLAFYQDYLNKDFDACYSFVYKPQSLPIQQIRNTFFKARIALCKNEKAEAERYFQEILQKAPHLNYAIFAKYGLKAIEKSIGYQDTFDALEQIEAFAIQAPSKVQSFTRTFRYIVGIFLIVFVIGYSALSVAIKIHERNENEKANEYEEQLAEYRENVRLLLSGTYDNVTVTDAFNLTNNGQVVEATFVALTDDAVLIGSLFSELNESELDFDIEYELPYSLFTKSDSFSASFVFECTVPQYYANCYFSTHQDDIPSECCHVSTVTVNEKTLYFVVTQVTTYPHP